MQKMKFFIIACMILALPTIGFANKTDKKIFEKIKHVQETPGLRWIKVDKENVIIGWEGMPQVFNEINRKVAIEANMERGQKVVVWSVRHKQKGYIVGTRPYLCKTTAKKGKVYNSSCRLF